MKNDTYMGNENSVPSADANNLLTVKVKAY